MKARLCKACTDYWAFGVSTQVKVAMSLTLKLPEMIKVVLQGL